jgi:hypothetical protein
MQVTATLRDGQSKIMIVGMVELNIIINNITIITRAFVAESLGAKLILGMDCCKSNNVNVNVKERQVEINHSQHGYTKTPFIENGSIDFVLAKSVILLTNNEHAVRRQVPLSNTSIVFFPPDFGKCAKLNVFVPESFVEIKDFSFYRCIFNLSKNAHTRGKNFKLGSVQYQSSDEKVYSIRNSRNQPSITEQSDHLHSIQETTQQGSIETSLVDDVLHELVSYMDKIYCNDFLHILRKYKHSFDTSKMMKANRKIRHTMGNGNHSSTIVRPYYKRGQQMKEIQQEVRTLMD